MVSRLSHRSDGTVTSDPTGSITVVNERPEEAATMREEFDFDVEEWTYESIEVGWDEAIGFLFGLVSRRSMVQVRSGDDRLILSQVNGVVSHVEYGRYAGMLRQGRMVDVRGDCPEVEYPEKPEGPSDWKTFDPPLEIVTPGEDTEWCVCVIERDFRTAEFWPGPGGGVSMRMNGYVVQAGPEA
jgi:hypothetical protein